MPPEEPGLVSASGEADLHPRAGFLVFPPHPDRSSDSWRAADGCWDHVCRRPGHRVVLAEVVQGQREVAAGDGKSCPGAGFGLGLDR